MSISGKMSVGVFLIDTTPSSKISSAITTNVYGRLSASLTIHIRRELVVSPYYLKISAIIRPRPSRASEIFQCHWRGNPYSLVRDRVSTQSLRASVWTPERYFHYPHNVRAG